MARTKTSHFDTHTHLTFRGPDGESVPVTMTDLAYYSRESIVTECQITLTLAAETYAQVDSRTLFHLARDDRGPGADHFTANGEVQIEARLDEKLLPAMLKLGYAPMEAGQALEALNAKTPTDDLFATESWYALHVTHAVADEETAGLGTLNEGYSTTWATDEDAEPVPLSRLSIPMLETAQTYLEEEGWEVERMEDQPILRWDAVGDNGEWTCFAVAREEEQRCAVYSQLDDHVAEEHRSAMAELLTRINYGLGLGNFEMDMSDGEIRFKTSISVVGDRLNLALFGRLVETNIPVMDAYLPALEAVMAGRLSPEKAVELVDN